ncbi:uncharacterized protein B0I36DRAFT_96766 [Microdochium trichocladiopsis]|uniref:Uncharacterized protein n=1 Tax=Microdochium trichocladiopsis TaxID=1682393 RepID=A0A9P8Y9Z1_9PEZI|nr:uncharacterized protein B0I36DRAFT_96766 [Microdochium trichocladiopsis]KAH7035779.1 hypothetical protein B0I36DRAFT_96766 [Microdochium trichocladiopsis]
MLLRYATIAAEMSRTAIIAASIKEPAFLVPTDFVSVMAPAARVASLYQQQLGISCLLFLERVAFPLNRAACLFQALTACCPLLFKRELMRIATMAVSASWLFWSCTTMRRLKRKLEFEFFTIMLSSGNHVCVFIFWPGWWLMAFLTLIIRLCVG